jgi:hypothetical protein
MADGVPSAEIIHLSEQKSGLPERGVKTKFGASAETTRFIRDTYKYNTTSRFVNFFRRALRMGGKPPMPPVFESIQKPATETPPVEPKDEVQVTFNLTPPEELEAVQPPPEEPKAIEIPVVEPIAEATTAVTEKPKKSTKPKPILNEIVKTGQLPGVRIRSKEEAAQVELGKKAVGAADAAVAQFRTRRKNKS